MGAHILGDEPQPHCFLSKDYFISRDIWVDYREPDMLWISQEANIGWDAKLVTQGHDTQPGQFGKLTARKIIIEKNAFIGAFSVLYNCSIGENAIVAVGSVVRSQIVEPFTMVAGNPAVVIKKYRMGKWV